MANDKGLVLVTGGAGFIGSHLVHRLVKDGYTVRVIDNLIRSDLSRLRDLIDAGRIEFIDGDVRYEDAVGRAMQGIDYVFHEAAVCINRSMAYPKESMDINLNGSHVVFQSALDHKVKRVVFASSASVYGDPTTLPMREDGPLAPITPYCVAKLSSEYLLRFFARKGLSYNILRYFNVYGPHQKVDAYYTSVIIMFIKRLIAGQAPVIQGTGEQTMDFVHVNDIVEANMLALRSDVSGEIFNVGSGVSTSVKRLAEILIASLGKDVTPQFSNVQSVVKHRQADITKIRRLLGFRPSVPVKEGLKEVAIDITKDPDSYRF
ncbi:SDR family NAD(P)-dependent oxidoreductase [Candidatus Woesearchaeota archaeon]|nr:SDR family NAD(P)-dependent oxidoreductase [Candidatus Woesearchaeota archaeon]